jgi:hypothetical protein
MTAVRRYGGTTVRRYDGMTVRVYPGKLALSRFPATAVPPSRRPAFRTDQ